jgi:hypothetical protein
MRISTKHLASIIKEAVSSELDIKSMSDADITSLISRLNLELKDREHTAKRTSFVSIQQAAEYLQDAALSDVAYDSDKVQSAAEFIIQKSGTISGSAAKKRRVDTIINLINKTNNLATDIDDSVDSRSRVKNQQRQQRNIATLYKLLIDAGVALDKKQLSTDSDWGGDAWRARDW